MQKKRLQTLIVPCLAALIAVDAAALGFAPVEPSTPLGQPLNHVIGLHLEAGESLSPECVAADVVVGETRLAPDLVTARLERSGESQVLRVRTRVPVDEPLVAMTLGLGCPVRLQRRFVVLADPVGGSTPSAPLMLAPAEDVATVAQADAVAFEVALFVGAAVNQRARHPSQRCTVDRCTFALPDPCDSAHRRVLPSASSTRRPRGGRRGIPPRPSP